MARKFDFKKWSKDCEKVMETVKNIQFDAPKGKSDADQIQHIEATKAKIEALFQETSAHQFRGSSYKKLQEQQNKLQQSYFKLKDAHQHLTEKDQTGAYPIYQMKKPVAPKAERVLGRVKKIVSDLAVSGVYKLDEMAGVDKDQLKKAKMAADGFRASPPKADEHKIRAWNKAFDKLEKEIGKLDGGSADPKARKLYYKIVSLQTQAVKYGLVNSCIDKMKQLEKQAVELNNRGTKVDSRFLSNDMARIEANVREYRDATKVSALRDKRATIGLEILMMGHKFANPSVRQENPKLLEQFVKIANEFGLGAKLNPDLASPKAGSNSRLVDALGVGPYREINAREHQENWKQTFRDAKQQLIENIKQHKSGELDDSQYLEKMQETYKSLEDLRDNADVSIIKANHTEMANLDVIISQVGKMIESTENIIDLQQPTAENNSPKP